MGWFFSRGGWVKRWRRGHPESAVVEVIAERSAENRRLRVELRETRSGGASS